MRTVQEAEIEALDQRQAEMVFRRQNGTSALETPLETQRGQVAKRFFVFWRRLPLPSSMPLPCLEGR
jgi:hypothetical protein